MGSDVTPPGIVAAWVSLSRTPTAYGSARIGDDAGETPGEPRPAVSVVVRARRARAAGRLSAAGAVAVTREATGHPTADEADGRRAQQEGTGLAAGEGPELLEHVPRLAVLEPVGEGSGTVGGLLRSVAGEALLLRARGHLTQLVSEGPQPAGRALPL